MKKYTLAAFALSLVAGTATADDHITRDNIAEVMAASDAAARVRDAAAVGVYLSDDFERVIEFPHKDLMATVRLDKMDYLSLIDEGWADIEHYDYDRGEIEIFVRPDGSSGQSNSTLTEHITIDGVQMTSRFREYAIYEIRNGRPVITQVSGHTLLGDTTDETSAALSH